MYYNTSFRFLKISFYSVHNPRYKILNTPEYCIMTGIYICWGGGLIWSQVISTERREQADLRDAVPDFDERRITYPDWGFPDFHQSLRTNLRMVAETFSTTSGPTSHDLTLHSQCVCRMNIGHVVTIKMPFFNLKFPQPKSKRSIFGCEPLRKDFNKSLG